MTDKPESPRIPNQTRERWATTTLRACLMHAENLRIIKPRATLSVVDLSLLPPNVYPEAFSKCQELIESACTADAIGRRKDGILRIININLWNFLVPYRQDGYSDFLVTKDLPPNYRG